ncbi:MAG: PQQ-like beta-propeller repeat protein [Spirochaetales bacterium]|nr:PQQ-like beta-propeller repeat protein [Spirochaetales bacterium]
MKPAKQSLVRLFMNIIPAAAAALILTACSPAAHWIMFRGEKNQGFTRQGVSPPLGIKWKLKLQDQPGRDRNFNPPIVVDNTVFFGSSDSNFYALDIQSGYMRWVFKTRAPINSIPYADDNKVYFGSSDGFMYAVDQKTGEKAWDYDTGHQVNSTVIGYKDMIVFTSDIGASHFFSPDGIELHRIPNPVWLSHSFQITDGKMYFAPGPPENPHSFGVYDIEQQKYLWEINTWDDGPTWYSFPAIKGGILHYATVTRYVDTWEYRFYGLDKQDGNLLWEHTEYAEVFPFEGMNVYRMWRENLQLLDHLAPAIWNRLVIYARGDQVVQAFKGNSGTEVWRTEFLQPVSSSPIVAGDRVYLGLRGSPDEGMPEKAFPSLLVCLSARTGKELWSLETDGDILSAPVIAGRWIIFGTDNHYFYVLEEVL